MKEFLAILAIALIVAIGGIVGFTIGSGLERQKAVKAGVARHIIDPRTGVSGFEYGIQFGWIMEKK